MTFAQAQFGKHLAASNASSARGHPISTPESLPEKTLSPPLLGLSNNQDFQFQNQLKGKGEQFQGAGNPAAARVAGGFLGKEEAAGLWLE